MMKTEKGWAVVGHLGVYYASFGWTRKQAISNHVAAGLGEWPHLVSKEEHDKEWKLCCERGDRAVKVTICLEKE